MEEIIKQAAEVLKRGGIILYPTDTVWGIGCDATNPEAVERIYALKERTDKHSMLVLMESPTMAARYLNKIPDVAWDLMEMNDKPLTLILPNATGVAANLLPGEKTLGVRIPAHEFCVKLIRRLGRPLVSTSANISGQPPAKTLREVDPKITQGVDMAIPEQYEGKPTRQPSSIISLGEGGQVKIIRE